MNVLDWNGGTIWSCAVDYHHGLALTSEGRVMILAGARTLIFDRPDLFEGCAEELSIHAHYFLKKETTNNCTTKERNPWPT